MEEIWKDIIDYEGTYQVSNFGNIKGYNGLRKPDNSNGYSKLTLHLNSEKRKFYAHRLVAIHFIPNPNNLPQVNHKDGDKFNNHVDNLEWVSRIENMCHANKNINKTSIYTGVYWSVPKSKWVSEIGINNKSIRLGTFDNEENAYQARLQYEKDNNIINKYI